MKNKAPRIAGAVLIPAAVAAAIIVVKRYNPPLFCRFYRLTGLYCPGCGTCRALEDIFRGNFSEAFSHNMLVFILGIPALPVLIYEYFRVFVFTSLPPVIVPRGVYSAIVVLVLAFWILRNIPLQIFSFLVP